jgi:phage terminase Nu1 subunit (DNA packaging protein)
MDLDQPCLQSEFADLVGISQPAVSDLLTRGVLVAKQTARVWLKAYTSQLREQAAGRGGDGMLAVNRAAESATRNELLQIKLKARKGEYAPTDAVERVLALIGSRIASRLEGITPRIKVLCPELPADVLQQVEAAVTDARNAAAAAGLAVLEFEDEDGDQDDVESAA